MKSSAAPMPPVEMVQKMIEERGLEPVWLELERKYGPEAMDKLSDAMAADGQFLIEQGQELQRQLAEFNGKRGFWKRLAQAITKPREPGEEERNTPLGEVLAQAITKKPSAE